ncbi:hypothetical protein EW146_g2232 [Bondarzewia mesenterica]|uniref:BHLH domain-containing protein n=1 Tax=Bondarzewia mesenterica TaxID=1095465 RepID=A0A4S4M2S4_9AGAM|nr:hypothetical protein EW146_g2232 [Bondarzewia mesenterica]
MESPPDYDHDHPKSFDFINGYSCIGSSYTTGFPARSFNPTHSIHRAVLSTSVLARCPPTACSRPAPTVTAALTPHRSLPFPSLIAKTSWAFLCLRGRSLRGRSLPMSEVPRGQAQGLFGDEDNFQPTQNTNPNKRIESEQRRRNELRDGYRRLKDALQASDQKPSNILIDSFAATTHVKYLEMTRQQLQTRLQQAENEIQRLRQVNEALMLGTAEQHHFSLPRGPHATGNIGPLSGLLRKCGPMPPADVMIDETDGLLGLQGDVFLPPAYPPFSPSCITFLVIFIPGTGYAYCAFGDAPFISFLGSPVLHGRAILHRLSASNAIVDSRSHRFLERRPPLPILVEDDRPTT